MGNQTRYVGLQSLHPCFLESSLAITDIRSVVCTSACIPTMVVSGPPNLVLLITRQYDLELYLGANSIEEVSKPRESLTLSVVSA